MESKKLIVIVSMADFAGSAFQACKAINSVGKFNCRAITMFESLYKFEADLVVPSGPAVGFRSKASDHPQYQEVRRLLREADLVHVWNDEPNDQDFTRARIDVPLGKVGVVTFTGTHYRRHHVEINRRLRAQNYAFGTLRLTVQDPCLKFPDETESVFIPHAINTEKLIPNPGGLSSKSIGSYQHTWEKSVRYGDVKKLEKLVEKEFPGWKMSLLGKMDWKDRMDALSGCSLFFQDCDIPVGYFGRSALEACSMGIPTFAYYSEKALAMSEGKLEGICIIKVTWENLIDQLNLFRGWRVRKGWSKMTRTWAEKCFSYKTVGQMYTNLYEEIL